MELIPYWSEEEWNSDFDEQTAYKIQPTVAMFPLPTTRSIARIPTFEMLLQRIIFVQEHRTTLNSQQPLINSNR
ncbi:MAG: hypothetical protein ABS22_06930 [SAR92 bacterium BACL16 MAG-120322-bin99]|nr:MAG: hypothetical protein ABS23_01270 [SAR92 bacterium BACL16 MAG-120619-bin48]KRP24868.1 MAG: hypothetical protein ABS22_06930 [SAR92 bacterium BACL16 MAG-120322-bin99]